MGLEAEADVVALAEAAVVVVVAEAAVGLAEAVAGLAAVAMAEAAPHVTVPLFVELEAGFFETASCCSCWGVEVLLVGPLVGQPVPPPPPVWTGLQGH